MSDAAFLAALRARAEGARRTLDYQQVWLAFDDTHRHLLPENHRQALADALKRLAAAQQVRLPGPKSRNWDRVEKPELPTQLVLVTAPKVTEKPWRTHPWHPLLAWAATERHLSAEQVEFLKRVEQGLSGNEFSQITTKKYRSLVLTGHEKHLDRFERTNLFAPGRLTPALLGYEEIPSPLRHHRIRPGGRWLVFENEELYGLTVRASVASRSGLPGFPWDAVACGHGRTANQALKWLVTLGEHVSSLEYIGDIDKAGLEILRDFKRTSAALGLPEVQAATTLLQAMHSEATSLGWELGVPQEGCVTLTAEVAAAVTAVLPEAHRSWAQAVLTAGRRMPEELLARHIRELLDGTGG